MEPLDSNFLVRLAVMVPGEPQSEVGEHDVVALNRVFDAQISSRHLDFQARLMQAAGQGYYTIGSAGHESNAFVADALRPTDPAFLHYRSGAFYQLRSTQVDGIDGIEDILLSLAAAADDPISGGRHKVFGRAELSIVPGTSTIASHLPRAVGVAFAIERAKKLEVPLIWPADGIVVCSIGDASINHSTAVGAINAACNTAFRGLNLPILFVCEDNGIGISVRTPTGWIEQTYSNRVGMRYFTADGHDPMNMQQVAREASEFVRTARKPAMLHIRCARFMGHAGSDVELGYRANREIQADYALDPLVATAQALVDSRRWSAETLGLRYEKRRATVQQIADRVVGRPKLVSVQQIMAPLSPRSTTAVRDVATVAGDVDARLKAFEGKLPEAEGKLTLAGAINRSLRDGLAKIPSMLIFGEDVGRKGGVYGVTARLQKIFGTARVFDTILDEQTVLGLGLGAAVSGMLPVPEIQYLAYLHNAIDQVRGEAATQRFFSDGQYRNGMVIRIAGLAYQKGFGGHFHNDNSLAAVRDIPGIVVAVPSRASDAAPMMRTALSAALVDGTVTLFVEPIALYHERDLLEKGDGGLLDDYPSPAHWSDNHVDIGSARAYLTENPTADVLTIVSFGNGVPMSLRVAEKLRREGIGTRVVDLRWLTPLPIADIVKHAEATGRVLVADETRMSGGVSESILTALVDAGFTGAVARVTSHDSFIPLADAAQLVLLQQEHIETAARALLHSVDTGNPVSN